MVVHSVYVLLAIFQVTHNIVGDDSKIFAEKRILVNLILAILVQAWSVLHTWRVYLWFPAKAPSASLEVLIYLYI